MIPAERPLSLWERVRVRAGRLPSPFLGLPSCLSYYGQRPRHQGLNQKAKLIQTKTSAPDIVKANVANHTVTNCTGLMRVRSL